MVLTRTHIVVGLLVLAGIGAGWGWVYGSAVMDRAAPSEPSAEVRDGNTPIAPTEQADVTRQPLAVAEVPSAAESSNEREAIDDLLPHVDVSRMPERLRDARSREEWTMLGIDQHFAMLFKQVKENQGDSPPAVNDKWINPRGLILSPSEGAQLEAVLAPLNDEVQRARAIHEASRYFAFREAALGGAVTFLPGPVEVNTPQGADEPFGLETDGRAMQLKAIKEYTAHAGGRNNFDYMTLTDFPENGVAKTAEEFWEQQRRTPAQPRTRILMITREENPALFAAKDAFLASRQKRRDAMSNFFASLGR